MREAVRVALVTIAARFSDDAPSVDTRLLRSRYSASGAWPADAELGLHILAWSLGPGFRLGEFGKTVNTLLPDFFSAAREVATAPLMRSTPSLITLGAIAEKALENAAVVIRWNLNPDLLYWPLDLSSYAGAL